jgi:hypothetical protein
MSKYDRKEVVYATLEDLMAQRAQNVTLLEVGTGTGKLAVSLCKYWREQTDGRFDYIGFDAFAGEHHLADGLYRKIMEPPSTKDDVARRLTDAGAKPVLLTGQPADTVPSYVSVMGAKVIPDVILVSAPTEPADLATVWAALRYLAGLNTVVLFDNYVHQDGTYGSWLTVASVRGDGAAWRVDVPPQTDRVDGRPLQVAVAQRLAASTARRAA